MFDCCCCSCWLGIGAVVVGLILYLITPLSMIFCRSPPKSRVNPFEKDAAKGIQPLVTDQDQRDDVLKEGFTIEKVKGNWDAIVVGSGIGGLAAAAIMAKSNKKVLVLEQHDQAGGCCHTFKEKNFEWDVGIHYVNMATNSVYKFLLDQISQGQIQWNDTDAEFDIVALGEKDIRRYPQRFPKEQFWKNLNDQFPKEKEALAQYRKLLEQCHKAMYGMVFLKILPLWLSRLLARTGLFRIFSNYPKFASISLTKVLDELTSNSELKAVLQYCFGDYGSMPSETAFILHSMLINHYMRGSSYPSGGASEIAFHIVPVIRQAGGKVLVRARVSSILVEQGRAVGVTITKMNGDVITIRSPIIISDAGILNTYTKLLKTSIPARFGPSCKPSISYFSLFLGLSGNREELNLPAGNTWYYKGTDAEKELKEYAALSVEEASKTPPPLLFVSFPSAKDNYWDEHHPHKSTATVIGFADFKWFEKWDSERVKNRSKEYKDLKEKFTESILHQLYILFPQVKGKIEYQDLGTPLTNNYYIGAVQGEVYGLGHEMPRFDPRAVAEFRPQTETPGLYLTGQDIFTVGFVPSLMAGMMTAGTVLGRNVYFDLLKLKKTCDKRAKSIEKRD